MPRDVYWGVYQYKNFLFAHLWVFLIVFFFTQIVYGQMCDPDKEKLDYWLECRGWNFGKILAVHLTHVFIFIIIFDRKKNSEQFVFMWNLRENVQLSSYMDQNFDKYMHLR